MNFPHKWPVTRKMFPYDDVIIFVLSVIVLAYSSPDAYYYMLYYVFVNSRRNLEKNMFDSKASTVPAGGETQLCAKS